MSYYRKKPLVIEAIQWNGENTEALRGWSGSIKESTGINGKFLVIPTLEGEHYASVGDYIIKGIHGEFYPCKPDIFEKSYEAL